MKPAVTILGAGPAGAALAWKLATRGFPVTLVEQNPFPGGNAASFHFAGQNVDFGSHRLHPSCRPDILADIASFLGPDLLTRPRHGRIHLLNHWLAFPLRPLDLALHAPPAFAAGVFKDALFKPNPTGPDTFASLLERGLGPTICRDFYFPYARKLWGIEPHHLDAEQARRRVSAPSISKLAARLLAPARRQVFHYPRHGFGQIAQAYAFAAQQAGARLLLSTKVLSITRHDNHLSAVVDTPAGPASLPPGLLFSTIPIASLARLLQPPCATEAAASLQSRALLLIYLALPSPHYTPFDAHYFPAPNIPITRLSEPKNYGLNGPSGSTVLCAELPCSTSDPLWSASDQHLASLVTAALLLTRLPHPGAPIDIAVRRLPHAYPIYHRGFSTPFSTLDHALSTIPGLVSLGRQGLFAHDNTHHTLAMAYSAAAATTDQGEFLREHWMKDRRIFLDHVVED